MKFKSLEALSEKGLMKEALEQATLGQEVGAIIAGMVGMAATSGIGAWMQARKEKANMLNVKDNITSFANDIVKDPDFKTKDEGEKAKARLYEIARVSPHLCLNRTLTKQLIKAKLHTGLSIEDKQRLVLIEAQYNKDPQTDHFLPKLASAEIGSIMADVVLVKEAALGRDFKTFAALSMLPIASGVIGGAINLGFSKVKEKQMAEALNNSFVQALSMSDKDTEPLLENKEKARKAFNTLSSFAPQVALDPQAARAFMNKIVSYDQGVDVSTIKELSEISRNLGHKGLGAFGTGFIATNKAIGATGAMTPAFEDLNAAVGEKLSPGEAALTPFEQGQLDARSKAEYHRGLSSYKAE